MKTFIYILAFLLLMSSCALAADEQPLPHRWVYLSTNLLVDSQVDSAKQIIARAKKAGYNGIVLTDYKFDTPVSATEPYMSHARAIKAYADSLGLAIYPVVCGIGYESGELFQDPNLAEALPVADASFVVKNGMGDIEPQSDLTLLNGDFEKSVGDHFNGWSYQDDPGKSTFADTTVRHGGTQSIRMERIGQIGSSGNARVIQELRVIPWHAYHLSVWVKTDGFDTPGSARAEVIAPNGKPETLTFPHWQIDQTQDWKQYDLVFNSLSNHKARIYLGVWGGHSGKIWWDDARIEPVGLLNVARRAGCPFKVTDAKNSIVYKEGKDYEPVHDDKLGRFDVYHAPVALRLTPGSRIREGEHLLVSYYHVIPVEEGSVAPCLSEPKLYELFKQSVMRVENLFHPNGYFLGQDEIRTIDWCGLCQSRHLTPGQLLADNTRRCIALVKSINPKAGLFIWSDMYDPNHNAHDNYYLSNGDLAGSWEGLNSNMTIVNWNSGSAKSSLSWFEKRGNPQVLAGYYDGSPDSIKPWLAAAHEVAPKVDGVMYTTWENKYDDLEAFAQSAWGGNIH